MERKARLDLLKARPLKALVVSPWFPYAFQVLCLVALVFIAIFGIGLYPPKGVPDKLYAKSNLVNLALWALWWPFLVLVTVFLGRIWCAVCPLELVSNLSERLGAAIGIKQKSISKLLASGILIFLLYAALHMLVCGIHLHRTPAYTTIFLFSLLGLALIFGLFFKDRAFCRSACPLGILLSVYGRGGTLAMRSKGRDACASCKGKECKAPERRYRLDSRSCPSLLDPPSLDSSRDCLFCSQCVKSCPHDNMTLFLRPLYSKEDSREGRASWPFLLFIMLVSGFITYELSSGWKPAKEIFMWVPTQVAGAIGLKGWISGIWKLGLWPLILWTILGGLVILQKGEKSMVSAWKRLAFPASIVVAFGHAAKAIEKMSSWGGFFPGMLEDPRGIEHAKAYASGALPIPPHVISISVISMAATLLLLLGTIYAVRETFIIKGQGKWEGAGSLVIPVILLGIFYMVFTIAWA